MIDDKNVDINKSLKLLGESVILEDGDVLILKLVNQPIFRTSEIIFDVCSQCFRNN